MKGGNKMRTRGKSQQNRRINEKSQSESDTCEEASKHTVEANIIADKGGPLRREEGIYWNYGVTSKRELVDFRGEVNQKLNSIATDLKEITYRVEETE